MPNRPRTNNRQFELTCDNNLLQAKRFVLDETATRYIGEMIRDVPRIIADAQDFAIPPFHTMWVEFPFDVLWHTVNPNPPPENVLGPTDKMMGFLIVGNHVRVGVAGDDRRLGGEGAVWCPIEYLLNHPMSIDEQLKFAGRYGISRMYLDQFFWGSSMEHFIKKANDPTDFPGGTDISEIEKDLDRRESNKQSARALRENHGLRIIDPEPVTAGRMAPDDFFHMSVAQSAGDLRNIISILLFLNRTSDIRADVEVGPKQQFIGNKLRPLLKHSVIRIKLDPKPRFKKMVAGEGVWRRLHDVRGHLCHNERAKTSGCMHPEWEETKPLHWVCTHCKGARWWRKEHARGHEEKGLVTSTYEVTK